MRRAGPVDGQGAPAHRHRPHPQTGRAAPRARLLSEIDQGRGSSGGPRATIAQLLDRWLETTELELTTRHTYASYINSKILPPLGSIPVRKIDVETLDRFSTELRKRGGSRGQPLAAMTVRQVHFILRAALGLAVKWGWIPTNPAERATVPRYIRQEVAPLTPAEVERFLAAAWERDPDLGALRWAHVRLDAGFLLISRSIAHRDGQTRDKDTKTHQARRVALDTVTAEILTEHRARCDERAAACAVDLRADGYVFSPTPTGSQPLMPDTVTARLRTLSTRLGIKVNLRSLRHYAATEMLTNGVDLRTAAGRLGHGAGGTTTLRVYTHFLPAPDLKAAEVLARSVPRPGQALV